MSSSESSDLSKQIPGIVSGPNTAFDAQENKMPRITSVVELKQTLSALTEGERDNFKLIGKVNDRMQKVGLTLPGVEVRWNNLVVELEAPRRPITQAIRSAVAAISRSSANSFPESSRIAASPSSAPSAPSRSPCSAMKAHRVVILDAGSGCLVPGRMCLLLGPPGAGRTTLLKALAGQLIPPARRRGGLDPLSFPCLCSPGRSDGGAQPPPPPPPMRSGRVVQHGIVSYNGLPADGSAFEVARAASYVGQTELHLPELTVKETLNFAADCLGQRGVECLRALILEREQAAGISPVDPDLELLFALAKGPLASHAVVEVFARMLAIDHVMDTLVGNEVLKGISGGQKRRVTCGEMAVGLCQVLLLDEVTNGLDAASALSIVRALRNMCEHANVTLLATLLQPSPDVVECFHDVMLVAGGRLLFHGSRETLLPFFGSMGLAPLPGQAVADFVQEVLASPQDQVRYRVAVPPPLKPLWTGHKWISPERMRRVFEASEQGQEVVKRLEAPPYSHPLQGITLRKETYGTGTLTTWRTVLKREAVLSLRNKAFFAAGLFQVLLTGFLVSTAFVRLKHSSTNDANLFMSVMFFSLMTLFMTGFNFGPIYCNRLPVFYKQRDHRFYSPTSYAIASVVMRLPEVVAQAVLYSVMVYFSVGFTMEVGRFFLFLINMLLAGLNSVTTFTLLSSVMRNESATQGIGAVFLMVSTLVCGFPIAPGSIPGWWIWMYWLMPMSWSFRSLVVTEMTSSAWALAGPDNPNGTTVGMQALKMRDIPSEFEWVWAGVGMVAAMSLLQVGLQVLALTYLGPLRSSSSGPEYDHDDDTDDHHLDQHRLVAQTGANGNYSNGNGSNGNGAFNPTAGSPVTPGTANSNGSPPGRRSWGSNSCEAWSATPAAAALAPAALVTATATDTTVTAAAVTAAQPPLLPGSGVELTTAAVAVATPQSENASGGQILAFRPVVMAFRDVSYFVRPSGDKKELQLLDKVSGVFRPGVLTSLMGASGAGKTTLMDVLAGRKTGGRVEGQQLVDGSPKRQAAFTRLMGYVEQLDVHNPHATVEEALLFSARLRVSSDLLPASNAMAFVRQMMEVVELGPLADCIIGVGGPSGGLSTEARKRLTIAVELVANPSIVFMDEPTTGLDARAAGLVMRAVRNTVATGRTVVCTIHQPNREIMDCFDELLLLKPGGRTIFFGPLGEQQTLLVSYLSSVPGVKEYMPHMNPAEWMLDVSSPAAEAELGLDFGRVWEASEQARVAYHLIDSHCGGQTPSPPTTTAPRKAHPAPSAANAQPSDPPAQSAVAVAPDCDIETGGKPGVAGEASGVVDKEVAAEAGRNFAQPTYMQLWLLLKRALVSHIRNSAYNGMRFAIAFALAWILGSLYWGRGKERNSIVGLMDIMGVIFSGALFLPMTNLMMVMPQVMSERAVFYRERASGMYRPAVFAAVQGLSEMPFVFVESILYVVIMYCTIQFEFTAEKSLWFWLYIWLALVVCTFMGMGFMNISPNMPAAIAGCSGLVLLWNLFCGFLIYRKDIKPWYLWAYYGNPITYIIYGCVTTQLGDVWDEYVDLGGGNAVPVAAFVRDNFDYEYPMRGWIVLAIVAFVVLFRLASYLGITRFSYQNR